MTTSDLVPSGDSIRVVSPLFQVGGGGSIPTSPLQLNVREQNTDMTPMEEELRIVHPLFYSNKDKKVLTSPTLLNCSRVDKKTFVRLNEVWHSKLPVTTNCFEGVCYGADFDGLFYAVAWWSKPIARALNGRGMFELRRFAISSDAPRNTATRLIKLMREDIKKTMPMVKTLISYQDTDVHVGTIYKASGWTSANTSEVVRKGWKSRSKRNEHQATGKKVRWEYSLQETRGKHNDAS